MKNIFYSSSVMTTVYKSKFLNFIKGKTHSLQKNLQRIAQQFQMVLLILDLANIAHQRIPYQRTSSYSIKGTVA